jgi:hypothetical protein
VDPISMQQYASIEEFKILREKYLQKEEEKCMQHIQTLSDLMAMKKEKSVN